MSNDAFQFAGTCYIAIYHPTTNVLGAFDQYEVDLLKINAPSERERRLSFTRENYQMPWMSRSTPKPVEVELRFNQLNAELLAAQLGGKIETLNSALTPFSDLPVTVVLDKWVPIGVDRIAETGFTVEPTAGADTYDEGVDFLVNRRLGLLKALSTGALSAGAVLVSGSQSAIAGTEIAVGAQPDLRLALKVDGLNLINERDVVVDAPRISVAAGEAANFFVAKTLDVPLKGEAEIPAPGARPVLIRYYD